MLPRTFHRAGLRAAFLALFGGLTVSAAAQDLTRLQSILDGLPAGGWAQVSTTTFSSVFPTGAEAVPSYVGYANPATIVQAWSSFAWDSGRGAILLFGGGHANYAGNEMYVWDATGGAWSRGSLPSRLDFTSAYAFVVDNAAPTSAHTYDNNVYLPVNGKFLTFGGAAYPLGTSFVTNNAGTPVIAGPWVWDPNLANPNQVGGTTGSGWNPSTVGGEMWTNRAGQSTGSTIPQLFLNGTTAVRVEGGKDTVYLTVDQNASSRPLLYRFTVGDLSLGQTDQWTQVGFTSTAVMQQGAGTLDNQHNFYIRTASSASGADLILWRLNAFNGTNPIGETMINLQYGDGSQFVMPQNSAFGIDFDQDSGRLVMWDGQALGSVYYVEPVVDTNGVPSSVWTVIRAESTTASQPTVASLRGVLGKWKYVDELDAFLALEEYSSGDAKVWIYKPFDAVVPVPEPSTVLMWLIGVVGVVSRARRERR